MRIMGIDYGSKSIGVAVSDGLLLTAQAKETITRNKKNALRRTYARLSELISEYEVSLIVVGLPLNMDGSEGNIAREAKVFADSLKERMKLPVIMQDERLTTFEASAALKEMNVKPENQKKYVDKIAAQIILQEYLDNAGTTDQSIQ